MPYTIAIHRTTLADPATVYGSDPNRHPLNQIPNHSHTLSASPTASYPNKKSLSLLFAYAIGYSSSPGVINAASRSSCSFPSGYLHVLPCCRVACTTAVVLGFRRSSKAVRKVRIWEGSVRWAKSAPRAAPSSTAIAAPWPLGGSVSRFC